MPQKSSIDKQAPEIREAIDKAIREDRATIDEIHEMAKELGADVSRSSVGRYKQKAEKQMERFREANELSKIWVGKLEETGDSELDRMLAELLKTAAYSTLSQMGDEEEAPDPSDIMRLAKGLKDLAGAEKLTVDRITKIREEVAKQAADEVDKVAKKGGMSEDTVNEIREQILGVAKK